MMFSFKFEVRQNMRQSSNSLAGSRRFATSQFGGGFCPLGRESVMADSSVKFYLRSRGVTLGTVIYERQDWPWNFGRFIPAAVFDGHAAIFAAAVSAHRSKNDQERDEALRRVVSLELQLVRCETGKLAGEPDLLWIDGDRINWRGSSGALRKTV
jgi:hypothetical protein